MGGRAETGLLVVLVVVVASDVVGAVAGVVVVVAGSEDIVVEVDNRAWRQWPSMMSRTATSPTLTFLFGKEALEIDRQQTNFIFNHDLHLTVKLF